MSELKSICVLNFLGRTTDWEGWSDTFLARSKRKVYKKLLIGKERVPTSKEHEKAVAEGSAGNKIVRSNNAHKQVFGDIIDDTTKQGNIAFYLVKCEKVKYLEGNCELLLKLVRKLSQETEESDFQILKQRTSGLNKIEEIQEKLKHRFEQIDKRLRKEQYESTDDESIKEIGF